jgi:hypothetical protein
MNPRPNFYPAQAKELAQAFAEQGVDYMFIGKSGAILLGYPGTTQDVCVYPARTPENGQRIIDALSALGFIIDERLTAEIIRGKDFVQLKDGPFDIDLVFAPDGIEDYTKAKARMHREDLFPIANIRDIIASKRAAGRARDAVDLPLLEAFRIEYEKQHPQF